MHVSNFVGWIGRALIITTSFHSASAKTSLSFRKEITFCLSEQIGLPTSDFAARMPNTPVCITSNLNFHVLFEST